MERNETPLFSTRMTMPSPSGVGSVATRRSSGSPSIRRAIRPSCGRRRSVMSMSAMTLMRLVSPACAFLGSERDILQHAVDAVAHAHAVLLRLEVDVAGAICALPRGGAG